MEEIHRIRCGSVNCYLITAGERAVLVDTGREAHRQQVLDACRGVKVGLIVLTHGHVDHAQNAAFLSQALGAPAALCGADRELLEDGLAQPLRARGLLGRPLLAASVRSLRTDRIPPVADLRPLEDGDSLAEYGVDARVIALPGHTRGSTGLDVAGKHLIAGDALMNFWRPSVSLLYHDRDSLMESAGRIGRLGPRRIWFGHGGPADNRDWIRGRRAPSGPGTGSGTGG